MQVLKEYQIVDGLVLVEVAEGQLDAAIAAYNADPNVLHAYRDSYATLFETPTDEAFSQQWALHNVGQSVNGSSGTFDADIDAPLTWNLSTGRPDFVVAIIDTGVDYNHPDLQGRVWTNPIECPGGFGTCVENGYDEDGNQKTDDFYGWNFLPPTPSDPGNSVRPGSSGPSNHGTLVAGVLAAGANNGGIVGVDWQSKIMILRVCGNDGCLHTRVIDALEYCREKGVRLSNNSYGFSGKDAYYCHQNYAEFLAQMQDLSDTIAELNAGVEGGHLLVAAAGNFIAGIYSCWNWYDIDGSPPNYPVYPASFDLPNIITVGATTKTDTLADWSMYGAVSVDLGAPGAEIFTSTFPGSGHDYADGTSMAAPHVTGVASLLWSKYPNWTYQQVRRWILGRTRPVPGLQGKTVSGGVVNAYRAVSYDCNDNLTLQRYLLS